MRTPGTPEVGITSSYSRRDKDTVKEGQEYLRHKVSKDGVQMFVELYQEHTEMALPN